MSFRCILWFILCPPHPRQIFSQKPLTYSNIWNNIVALTAKWNCSVNNTLQNGFRLLEMLAASGKEASVTEVAEETGISMSNVCRLLKTLAQTGYVEQNPESRRYRVSLKILNLAHARLASLDFRRIGHPFAARLTQSLGGHAYLSQPLQGRSLIVDVAYPNGAHSDAGIVLGQFHSIRHSACGKICAAFASDEERDRLYLEVAGTEPEINREAWLNDCRQIKKNVLQSAMKSVCWHWQHLFSAPQYILRCAGMC